MNARDDGCGESGLSREQRVELFKAEMELVQTRFDKFDQMFHGNRRYAVTIVAAAVAASAALDERLVLIAASGVTLVLFGLELFHRRTLVSRLVERHLLLRAALNDEDFLMALVVYDPFNDMRVAVPERWRLEHSRLFDYEAIMFYLVVSIVPLALALFAPTVLRP